MNPYGMIPMDTLLRDIRYGVRRLQRTPGFTAIAVLSLALGIGANTAIFSLVNAVLLRDPIYTEPERLVELYGRTPDFPYSPVSWPDLRDLDRASQAQLEGFASAQFTMVPLDLGDRVETVAVEMVNGDYFRVLGLRPALGRLFSAEDDAVTGGHPLVVLSHDHWQKQFGGDPGALGRTLRLNGRDYTVIGVAPRGWGGVLRGLAPALFVPKAMINQLQPSQGDQLQARSNHSVFVKARMRDGVAVAEVRTVAAAFSADMRREHRADWPGDSEIVVTPATEVLVNPMLDRVLVPAAALLLVVVGLVLLIACANLASFLLARARDRQREVAIRLALGAGRGLLIRQLLTESVLLALAGGLAGVVLAKLLLGALLGADLPLPLPITLDLSLDPVVLGYALAAALSAGALFGLAPALQATRADVITTIKNENTGGGPRRMITLRGALVVVQVAGSLVLLVTAGLFLRSLAARQAVDIGFGGAPTSLVGLALPTDRYPVEKGRAFIERLEADIAALPGVEAVGLTQNLHLNPLSIHTTAIGVEGHEPPEGQVGFNIDNAVVDAGFFAAAGLTLRQGRGFTRADVAGGELVVVINEALARRFWPDGDALGRTFNMDGDRVRIVGIANTAKIRMVGEEPRPFIYRPYSQHYTTYGMLVVRVRADAERFTHTLLQRIRDADPDAVIVESNTLERHVAAMMLPAQLGAIVFAGFASLALTLALIGIYGVVSYSVARRTREIGIRMSLGADAGRVVRLLVRDGLALVLVGTLLGLAVSLAAARLLSQFLFGIRAFDPVTLVAVPLAIVTIGAAAALVPAWRASRIAPARVLSVD